MSSKSFCRGGGRSDWEVQDATGSYWPFVRAAGGCGFRLVGDKSSILQLREEHGVAYKRSIPGCQLIDWLLQNGEVEGRRQGVELCRALLEQGIIQHGKSPHPVRCLNNICFNKFLLPTLTTHQSATIERSMK